MNYCYYYYYYYYIIIITKLIHKVNKLIKFRVSSAWSVGWTWVFEIFDAECSLGPALPSPFMFSPAQNWFSWHGLRATRPLLRSDAVYSVVWLLQEYETALKFTSAILKAEPSNRQAQQLEAYIQKKLRNGMLLCVYSVGQKKWDTILLSITSPNMDQFS